MNNGKSCQLTSDNARSAGEYYVELMDIIQQAQTLGLDVGELNNLTQGKATCDAMPLSTVIEQIKKARRNLYQQMMDFEILDRDLAELQSVVEEPARQAPAHNSSAAFH